MPAHPLRYPVAMAAIDSHWHSQWIPGVQTGIAVMALALGALWGMTSLPYLPALVLASVTTIIATIGLELVLMSWLRRSLPRGSALLPAGGVIGSRLDRHRRAWSVVCVLVRPLALPVVRRIVLRLAGARIGTAVLIADPSVCPDPHLLAVEAGAIIEAPARLLTGVARGGRLILAPIRIGRDAIICRNSILHAGTAVADGAIVSPGSVIGCGERIGPGICHRRVSHPADPQLRVLRRPAT